MRKLILSILGVLPFLFIMEAFNTDVHSSTSGSPAGYTGSPLEFGGRTCGSNGGCHGGGTTNQPSIITHNIPACGYIPGETYSITITATFAGRSKFGFQFSAQNATTGATAGTIITNGTINLISSGRYANHVGTSTSGNGSRSWTFQWTAPSTGVGNIGFYAAVNCTNSNNSSSGDIIFNTSVIISQATPLVLSSSAVPEICEGESITLQSNISTGNTWQLNGAAFGTPGASTINANLPGTYTLTNVDGNCEQSQSLELVVNNTPQVPVVSISGNTEFCEGENVQLSASSNAQISWFPGNINEENILINSSGSYFAQAQNNCGTANSEEILINVIGAPAMPIIVSESGLNSFCEGSSLILTAVGENLSWSNGAEGNTVQVFEGGEITVTAQNICFETTSLPFQVAEVNLPPTPLFVIIGETRFCAGESVQLVTDGNANITWFPGGETSNSLVVTQSGIYNLVASNGCGSSSSDSVSIEVVEIPETPVIILQQNNLLEVNNVNGTFTWYRNNEVIANATSNTYQVTEQGTYAVEVSNEEGCISDISENIEIIFTNLNNLTNNNFNIYPNPAQNVIYINYENALNNYNIRILSLDGKIVHEQTVAKQTSKTEIFVNDLKGLFILELNDQEVLVRKKLYLN